MDSVEYLVQSANDHFPPIFSNAVATVPEDLKPSIKDHQYMSKQSEPFVIN